MITIFPPLPRPHRADDKTREVLSIFSDIIYAVAFGFIMESAVEDLGKHPDDIWGRLAFYIVLFYFLFWDWVLGRLLTLRNPYRGYSRFGCELLIAGFNYCVGAAAIHCTPTLLLALFGFFIVGGIWALFTRNELVDPRDRREIRHIPKMHFVAGPVTVLACVLFWDDPPAPEYMRSFVGCALVIFIYYYESRIPRLAGLRYGPGLFLLTRKTVGWLRKRELP